MAKNVELCLFVNLAEFCRKLSILKNYGRIMSNFVECSKLNHIKNCRMCRMCRMCWILSNIVEISNFIENFTYKKIIVEFCRIVKFCLILSNLSNFAKFVEFCQICRILSNLSNFVKFVEFHQICRISSNLSILSNLSNLVELKNLFEIRIKWVEDKIFTYKNYLERNNMYHYICFIHILSFRNLIYLSFSLINKMTLLPNFYIKYTFIIIKYY